uniref:hypothetical protein n=1 Tax=Algoriphagus sp. TaxID=1872435 RepID=UPI00404859BC
MPIRVIAFDADDTLWINETYFREAEEKFASLLEDFLPQHAIMKELYRTEIANLRLYGYGIKGFMLSMIETALRISEQQLPIRLVERIIQIGQEMLTKGGRSTKITPRGLPNSPSNQRGFGRSGTETLQIWIGRILSSH